MALKEYIYKNRTIYISYYTDKAYGDFKGNYTGIILKDDKDKFYKINYAFKTFDPNKGNVDEWISTMCSGIITFN